MANQPESASYDAGVYELEVADPVQGGVGGVSNKPLLNLANRTAYLKQHLDAIENGTDIPSAIAPINSPQFTGNPKAPTPALGDDSTSIPTTDFVQKTISGVLTKSVAGNTNVTLSAVEAGNGIWIFNGALTGNIDVIVPAVSKQMLVLNRTSGAYTLRVKTAAGTGVYVAQNKQQELACDGVNVFQATTDFSGLVIDNTATLSASPPKFDATLKLATMDALKSAGWQFGGQSNMAAAGNLTPTQAGQLVNLSGTPGAVFLPLAGAVPAGTIYALISQNAGWIISTAGGQYMNAGSTTFQTVTMNAGDTAVFESDGSSNWVVCGGSVQLPYAATLRAQLGNLSSVYGLSGSTQLTAAHFGSLIADNVSGAAATYTLPASTAAYLGKTISFLSVNGNGCRVACSGSENIVVGGPTGGSVVTAIGLKVGDTLTVVNIGTGWYAVSGSALLPMSGQFAASLAVNGWQKLPSGLIIQWGEVFVSATNGNYNTFAYPLRFPNALFGVTGNREALGSNAVMLIGRTGGDPLGQLLAQNFAASGENAYFIATGY